MNKTILECNGIAAGYVKGLNILQGVDLVVHEGEIVSIIGPNGAGKSTLLKAIMSLIKVSAGRFYINGIEKTNLSTHKIVTEGIGYRRGNREGGMKIELIEVRRAYFYTASKRDVYIEHPEEDREEGMCAKLNKAMLELVAIPFPPMGQNMCDGVHM